MKTSLAEPGCGVQSSQLLSKFSQSFMASSDISKEYFEFEDCQANDSLVCIMWIESQLYTKAAHFKSRDSQLKSVQGVLAQYEFWDLEKIVLCEIRTSVYYIANFHQYYFTTQQSGRNSTSTDFIPIALKFVLVEIVLVETVLVGDPLYYAVLYVF